MCQKLHNQALIEENWKNIRVYNRFQCFNLSMCWPKISWATIFTAIQEIKAVKNIKKIFLVVKKIWLYKKISQSMANLLLKLVWILDNMAYGNVLSIFTPVQTNY